VAGGKRGRPPRWDDHGDVRVWARVRFLDEREGLGVRGAAKRLEALGLFTVRDGQLWLSKPATGSPYEYLEQLERLELVGADQRENVAEVIRQRFYKAERRRKTDAAFASDCDFWLRFEREYAASGDASEAFSRAFTRATLDT
jgi:hypothetical protein